jgi:hypothetical protein
MANAQRKTPVMLDLNNTIKAADIVTKMEVAFAVGWLDGFNGSRNDMHNYRPDLMDVYQEGFLEGQISWNTRGL